MSDLFEPQDRSWVDKFRDSFRGLYLGVVAEKSFYVHILMALAVVSAAALFRVSATQWCLLLLSIAVVTAAEMFNTALERLAKAVDTRINPLLAEALDIASAAVLLVSIGAALVGAIIFLGRLVELLFT